MDKNTKLIWMFTPLVILFIGLVFYINDVRNPNVNAEECMVLARGVEAYPQRKTAKILYSNSGEPVHDLSLSCQHSGEVLVNDFDISFTDATQGDEATLTHRQYQYLPERWEIDVSHPTEKPASTTINQPVLPTR